MIEKSPPQLDVASAATAASAPSSPSGEKDDPLRPRKTSANPETLKSKVSSTIKKGIKMRKTSLETSSKMASLTSGESGIFFGSEDGNADDTRPDINIVSLGDYSQLGSAQQEEDGDQVGIIYFVALHHHYVSLTLVVSYQDPVGNLEEDKLRC
jgi:hypothetical protein